MRRHHHVLVTLFLSSLIYTNSFASPNYQYGLNAARIEYLTGAKGKFDQQEQIFKISVPRNDLKVTVNGAAVTPAMGLTSWASFKKIGNDAFVIGDFALTEDQIYPVMDVVIKNNLNITGLNNRFLWESPRVMFMHVEGTGKEDQLAIVIGKIFQKIKATSKGKGDLPYATLNPADSSLHPAQLDSILGKKGTLKDGVYKVIVANKDKSPVGKVDFTMGANTWAAFAGSDKEAVLNGDLVINEVELQEILKTLHNSGIYVSGIYQRMPFSDSQMLYLHYWGVGDTKKLAKGLRIVFDYDNKMKIVARKNAAILAWNRMPRYQLSAQLNKLCCQHNGFDLQFVNALLKEDLNTFFHQFINKGATFSPIPKTAL